MYQNSIQVVSFKVNKKIVDIIDLFVEVGLYNSRSEFIREALRTLIQQVLEKHKKLIEEYVSHRPIKKAIYQILSNT